MTNTLIIICTLLCKILRCWSKTIGGCSLEEHAHNNYVLIVQNLRVLVLGGMLVLVPSTLY